jgi:putative ABC transport system permease protein
MTIDDLKESAIMALVTLRVHKLRSILTILGVTVGVVTVLSMVSIIQGLDKSFAEQLEVAGLQYDLYFKIQTRALAVRRKPKSFTARTDAARMPMLIRDEAQSVIGVSPLQRKLAETVRYKDKQTDTPVFIGITPYYEFVTLLVCRPRPLH